MRRQHGTSRDRRHRGGFLGHHWCSIRHPASRPLWSSGLLLYSKENNNPRCFWAAEYLRASPAPEEESWYRSCGGWYSKTRLVLFKLLCHSDDTAATHPRFVVRNTISICLAFGLGWVGLWNTMPSYSAYPASTIGVIVQLLRQSMFFL